MADADQRIRILFLGSGSVGKTTILKRFLFNTYSEDYKKTVEDLYARDFNIRGSLIKVDFLDTAGDFVFPAMKRLNITTAHAFVLVYAITSQESFEEVKRLWAELQESRPTWQTLPCVIVGTMIDLENARQVEKFDTLNWIYGDNYPGGFVEVSAKEDENIDDIFRLLLSQSRGEGRHLTSMSHALSTRRRSTSSFDETEPEVKEEWDSDAKNFNRSRSLVRRGSKPKMKRTARRNKHDCKVS